MTAQRTSFCDRPVPRWTIRALSTVSLAMAIAAFAAVFFFQRRALSDDLLAAVASALIGSILLIAGVVGFQYGHRHNVDTKSQGGTATYISNGIVGIVAAVLGTVAVAGSIGSFHDFIIVLNQEHLHFFESSLSIHSSTSSQNVLIAEFALTGFVLLAIGVFLLLYASASISNVVLLICSVASVFGFKSRSASAEAIPENSVADTNAADDGS